MSQYSIDEMLIIHIQVAFRDWLSAVNSSDTCFWNISAMK